MSKMVDSKKQTLNFAEIAGIAFENTRLTVPKKFAMTGVLSEVINRTQMLSKLATLFSFCMKVRMGKASLKH